MTGRGRGDALRLRSPPGRYPADGSWSTQSSAAFAADPWKLTVRMSSCFRELPTLKRRRHSSAKPDASLSLKDLYFGKRRSGRIRSLVRKHGEAFKAYLQLQCDIPSENRPESHGEPCMLDRVCSSAVAFGSRRSALDRGGAASNRADVLGAAIGSCFCDAGDLSRGGRPGRIDYGSPLNFRAAIHRRDNGRGRNRTLRLRQRRTA